MGLHEAEQHMLLAAEVFEKKEWAKFEELLPDLNPISTFGQGIGCPAGITPTHCLFFLHTTTILHKALWVDAPVSTVQAILEKQREDPLERNLLSTANGEQFLPLHVAAGASDSLEVVKILTSSFPIALLATDEDGHRPIDIIQLGGCIDGQPPRKHIAEILMYLNSQQNLSKCPGPGCAITISKSLPSLKKCSRCQAIAYCSVNCQRKSWKKHKVSCK